MAQLLGSLEGIQTLAFSPVGASDAWKQKAHRRLKFIKQGGKT